MVFISLIMIYLLYIQRNVILKSAQLSQKGFAYEYSSFTLRNARSPLILSGGPTCPKVNRLCVNKSLANIQIAWKPRELLLFC